jgi:acetolactate synthase-1/2/3 large subunit
MRVCDYIANQLSKIHVKRIFGLMGGGASGLNDGFIKHPDLEYICLHNEQGAAHAAIGESKFRGWLSVVNPTTGCGGTNCITSVLDAYQDSVPLLFISGNVRQDQTTNRYNNTNFEYPIRKYGIQEHDIIPTIQSIVKYSYFLNDADYTRGILQNAVNFALSPRRGPVWIDIPADIQIANIPDDTADIHLDIPKHYAWDIIPDFFTETYMSYKTYTRPLFLAGGGIGQSGLIDRFRNIVEKYSIPYVSTYAARDYMTHDDPYNIGTIGIKGSRAGNMALQKCDVLIMIGTSLNVSHIGYDSKNFAPSAFKIHVDCDANELYKKLSVADEKMHMHLDHFFNYLEKKI